MKDIADKYYAYYTDLDGNIECEVHKISPKEIMKLIFNKEFISKCGK